MRAALSAVARWLRDAWNLPWRLKGAFLGALILVVALAMTLTVVVATGGKGSTRVDGVAQAPSPTATITPSPTPTPTAKPTPSPTPVPPPTQAQPPAPAAAPGLTSAEVIECEGGEFDGWDDAFNVRPHGFTLFPAPLKLTTDPAACEDLWLAAYDDGYSRGKDDKCSIVSDYLSVASPQELEFCGVEPPPPLPTQPLHPILDPDFVTVHASSWIMTDGDALRVLAVLNPPLYYADLVVFPQDCTAIYDDGFIWWVVTCQAQEYACILEGVPAWCPTYSVKLCVSDIEPFDIFAPC